MQIDQGDILALSLAVSVAILALAWAASKFLDDWKRSKRRKDRKHADHYKYL